MTGGAAPRWWQSGVYFWALVTAAFVPLIWPAVPPLADLPAHMARYRIAAGGGASDALSAWYHFQWHPIGNLGVDALVIPLSRLIGLVAATKLVVIMIPPLTVWGMLLLAREVHGMLPATAAFAVPLAYGFPFLFGFVNFCLSMALMLLALWLWLRLGRAKRTGLRVALFIPISLMVYFAHVVGWGVLGLACFAIELRAARGGRSWPGAFRQAVVATLPLAGPLLLLLAWRSGGTGEASEGWFALRTKLFAFSRIFCDRWRWFDLLSLAALIRVAVYPVSSRNGFSISPTLAAPALILLAAFLIVPHQLFGSSYADSRLAGFALAFWILSLRKEPGSFSEASIAAAGALFVAFRLASVTASLAIEDAAWEAKTHVLEQVRPESRVASLVAIPCEGWAIRRSSHLGSFAVIRRSAFSNDQWSVAGSRLLTISNPAAGRFIADPSQLVTAGNCPELGWPVGQALSKLPRPAFDYLWLIDMPASVPVPAGWVAVAGSGSSRLLRRADTATGQ